MFRRVVTTNVDGKARFTSDGAPAGVQAFKATPGMATCYHWATMSRPEVPQAAVAETLTPDINFLPKIGETRFLYLQIPPESVFMQEGFDPAAAGAEMMALQPEMTAKMEPDNPGMHRTDTIDYVIVLDGEIYLEVDDQEEVLLRRHDCVVQNGTRHAWRNRSDKPALLAVVLIGAERRD